MHISTSFTVRTVLTVASLLLAGLISMAAFSTVEAASGYGSVKINVVVAQGSANPSSFSWYIKKAGSSEPGRTIGSGSTVTFGRLTPGAYTVVKAGGPSGYGLTWSGDCDAQGNVTVSADSMAVCTATNTFGTSGGGGGNEPRPPRSTRTPR